MIHLAMLLALSTPADTTRCTWEGRLPERGAYQPAVSRPSQIVRLTRAFRTGSKNDRLVAVRSLGAIGDVNAMPLLIEAAADTNKHVALEAVWTLGRMRRIGGGVVDSTNPVEPGSIVTLRTWSTTA